MLNERIIAKIEAIPVPQMKVALWLGKPRKDELTLFVDKEIMSRFISPFCTHYFCEGKNIYLLEFDERYSFEEFVNYINAIIDVIAESTKKEEIASPKKKSNVGIFYEGKLSHSMTIDCPEEYQERVRHYGNLKEYTSHKNRFVFDIDSRFDFDEVKQYLLSL